NRRFGQSTGQVVIYFLSRAATALASVSERAVALRLLRERTGQQLGSLLDGVRPAQPVSDLLDHLVVTPDVLLGVLHVLFGHQVFCVRRAALADMDVARLVDANFSQRNVVLRKLHEVLANQEWLVRPAQPLVEPSRVFESALP